MNWIVNQKRYRPGYFVGNILVMTAEMTLLNICLILFLVVVNARGTDWYRQAMEQQVSTDVFAGIKDKNLFIVLAVAVGFVVLFAVISSCMFYKMQLENMQKQLGMFLTCGYTKKQLEWLLGIECGIDIMISVPFMICLSIKMLEVLKRREEFLVMLSSIHMDGVTCGILFFSCMVILYLLFVCYGKVWLKKTMKGGLAYMIRQDN